MAKDRDMNFDEIIDKAIVDSEVESSKPAEIEAAAAPESVEQKPVWAKTQTIASTVIVLSMGVSAGFASNVSALAQRAEEQKFEVAQLETVRDISYMLTEDGKLYAQGINNVGQLGIGSLSPSPNWTRVLFSSDDDPEPVIKKISTQGDHVLALDETGGLWSWGSNAAGVLGNGGSNVAIAPKKLAVSYAFEQIETGKDFAVAIDIRGAVYTWGANESGQLGLGDTDSRNGPTLIPGLSLTSVKAGNDFVLALDAGGNLWAWGSNSYGQFGDNTTEGSLTPKRIGEQTWSGLFPSKLSKTVAALDANGRLWTWGSNEHALLGLERDWRGEQAAENKRVEDEIKRIQAEDEATRAELVKKYSEERVAELKKAWDEKVEAWENDNPKPKRSDFPDPEPEPEPTPPPTPTPTPTPQPQETGEEAYAKALKVWEDKRAQWIEANPEPNLSNLPQTDKNAIEARVTEEFKPRDTSTIKPAVIKEPKLDTASKGPKAVPVDVAFTAVSVGAENAFAIDTEGRLWGWGSDANGQSGIGLEDSKTYTHRPVLIVQDPEAPFKSVYAGELWATAASESGLYAVGINPIGAEKKLLKPTQVAAGDFKFTTGDRTVGAAIKTDGTSYSFGLTEGGRLGIGERDEARVGLTQIEGAFKDIAFGARGTLALGAGGGHLYFWGSDNGISGNEVAHEGVVYTPAQHAVDSFKSIGTGRISSHAVDSNGLVWTWGATSLRSIGDIHSNVARPVQVPTAEPVRLIAGSYTDVIFVTESGKLQWWGSHAPDYAIQTIATEGVDVGEIVALSGGQDSFTILDKAGKVFSFATDHDGSLVPGQKLQTLTEVALPGPATAIEAGPQSSLAVVDGVTYAWGVQTTSLELAEDVDEENGLYMLRSPYSGKWAKVSATIKHGVGVTDAGALFTWGQSNYIAGLGPKTVSVPIATFMNEEG